MTNIAVRAARDAGRILLRYFDRVDSLKVSTKQRNDFVTEVDKAAEAAIIETIRKAYPDHAILAEESGSHDGNDYLWVIDPLDGTTNYLHGFPQFSVSIGLQFRGELQSAVVYDPLREEMFSATKGSGAYLNERRLRVSAHKGLDGALLGTGIPFRELEHVDAYLAMMKTLLADTAGIRRPGSAALDFSYVAAGRLDGFWELGLAPWDMAAGALLVKEAGGMVTDISGGELYLKTGNVITAGIGLHPDMVKAIRPHLSAKLSA
jgi:myo-inositol-1(or 4)-monophosphatase